MYISGWLGYYICSRYWIIKEDFLLSSFNIKKNLTYGGKVMWVLISMNDINYISILAFDTINYMLLNLFNKMTTTSKVITNQLNLCKVLSHRLSEDFSNPQTFIKIHYRSSWWNFKFLCSFVHIDAALMHPTCPLLILEDIEGWSHDARELSCWESFAYSGLIILFPSPSSIMCGTWSVPNKYPSRLKPQTARSNC